MRSRWLLPGLSAGLIVVALLAWGVPWLTRDRTVTTSTPTPPAFQAIAPIELERGQQACESLVALSTDTRTVVLRSAKFTGSGPPLDVVVSAPGYRASTRVPAGYTGEQQLSVAIPAPPRNAIGDVCVRNAGRRAMALQGTTEGRIQNRSATSVDGELIVPKMTLLLAAGRDVSLAGRPGQIMDRIAAFKPPLFGRVSLGLLGLLVLVGAPVAVVYAIARGIAADED
jgi:hypothetical protein